jgi:AraC-like DNA-binding protein
MFRRRLFPGKTLRCDALPGTVIGNLIRGEAMLSADHSSSRVLANQWFLLRPGTRVEVTALNGEAEYCLLFIDCLAVSPHPGKPTAAPSEHPWERLRPSSSGQLRLGSEPSLVKQLAKLQEAYRFRRNDPFLANIRFQSLIGALVERLQPEDAPNAAEWLGIKQSVEYIHQSYTDKIRLDTLAHMAGFTPTSYSREFKKVMGTSPSDYINELRIARAKKLLLDRRHTIKQVSALSGFGSEFYFSRSFRKATGVSPTLYIKRSDLRIAVATSFRYAETLRSLDIEPVAAINCRKRLLMHEDEHKRLIRTSLAELDDAKPDLVLCDPWHLRLLKEEKRDIAALEIRYSMDWRLVYGDIAEAIGREAAASVNLAKLEKRLEEVRIVMEQHFGGETFTFMRLMDRLIRIQGMSNHPLNDLIYTELGLRPGYCVHSNLMHVEFAADNHPNLETDHLIVQTPATAEDQALYGSLRQTPGWQSIRAAAAGHVYEVCDWAGLSWSASGRMRILDDLLAIANFKGASGSSLSQPDHAGV